MNNNQYVPVAVIGVSHKTAPVEIREGAALDNDSQQVLLTKLYNEFDLEGVLILSTCNRTEVYVTGDEVNILLSDIRKRLDAFKEVPYYSNDEYVYIHKGKTAVRHFFKVISGLDSQMIGEPQITGQVKLAYEQAHQAGVTDTLLNKIYNYALQSEKKIRSNTFISEGAVSISFAGVELARKIFSNLEGLNVLLIGAGETVELAATHFMEKGVRSIKVVNRTLQRAQQLASKFNGQAFTLDQVEEALTDVDIVISATAGERYILDYNQLKRISKRRQHEPLFLIDLAMPRDIDPKGNQLDGIYLYNMDDLQEVVDKNLQNRREEIPKAMKFIDQYMDEFSTWMATYSISSTIKQLRRYFDDVRYNELQRLKSRLPQEGMEQVEYLTQSIVNKLLHQHIKILKSKNNNAERKQQKIEIIHELYDLNRD
ncbi:MAG: glutamyl-tRNA reductase [Caldithrix sp.]|nr:glutamyl-tRNA reductase [Caldithrix sp.]